ncbi:MAG TPA: hypothetical protein VKB53_03335, partial [Gammaproteobacteria bacterium]|nr:hypothetical protein [Gammaproteobacteria bacterium]
LPPAGEMRSSTRATGGRKGCLLLMLCFVIPSQIGFEKPMGIARLALKRGLHGQCRPSSSAGPVLNVR